MSSRSTPRPPAATPADQGPGYRPRTKAGRNKAVDRTPKRAELASYRTAFDRATPCRTKPTMRHPTAPRCADTPHAIPIEKPSSKCGGRLFCSFETACRRFAPVCPGCRVGVSPAISVVSPLGLPHHPSYADCQNRPLRAHGTVFDRCARGECGRRRPPVRTARFGDSEKSDYLAPES